LLLNNIALKTSVRNFNFSISCSFFRALTLFIYLFLRREFQKIEIIFIKDNNEVIGHFFKLKNNNYVAKLILTLALIAMCYFQDNSLV